MKTIRTIGTVMVLLAFLIWIGQNFYFGWNWKPQSPEEAAWDAIVGWMVIIGFVLSSLKIIIFEYKRKSTRSIQEIARERREQIKKHGRSIQYDVVYNNSRQLIQAAGMLTHPSTSSFEIPPMRWNKEIWDKMRGKPYRDRLVTAAALIAAEIDRLDNSPLGKEERH
jgi:hypothetical protein